MRTRFSLPILPVLLCIALGAQAQERLKLDLSHRCIFYPEGREEELYSFPTESQEVPQLVAEILRLGGDLEQNFVIVQANVENVSAVVDGEKRYLLWSIDFWENATPLKSRASLAHEIGHHVNLHRLTNEYREIEEREADEFMGFVLGMKDIPPINLSIEMQSAGIFSISDYDRKLVILQGYTKAEKTLKISALAFDNDPSWADFLKAEFPFPPPECYQSAELQQSGFSNCTTLGDAGKKISHAFEMQGYPYRFMSVPDGFAVVTQLEQYQDDGSIIADSRTRWQELPQAENFSLSLAYLKSLVMPRKAQLRIFVVLVTQRSYPSTEERISKEAAKAWISHGLNRLPKTIAEKPFNADYSIDMLVYEFEVPETDYKLWQHCPCHLDARIHLRKTGLDNWLR